MSQQELLTKVVQVLDRMGIEYMLTGSFASSLQGEPRTTHDIDLVVAIAPGAAEALTAAFPAPRYYLDAQSIRDAIAHGSMFNLIDIDQGDKVDFWILTVDPFDESRFARRHPERIGDAQIYVSRPEDTILMKLRWAEMSGGSEKQFTDALRVYEVQYATLDQDYLERWAVKLGILDLWTRLKNEAEAME